MRGMIQWRNRSISVRWIWTLCKRDGVCSMQRVYGDRMGLWQLLAQAYGLAFMLGSASGKVANSLS